MDFRLFLFDNFCREEFPFTFCLAIRFRPLSFHFSISKKKIACASFQLTQTILHSRCKPIMQLPVFFFRLSDTLFFNRFSLKKGAVQKLSFNTAPFLLLSFRNPLCPSVTLLLCYSVTLVRFLSVPRRPYAAGGRSRQRIFRPVMFWITPSQFLAHCKVAFPSKS